MEEKGKKLSRKDFIRVGGSTVAGIGILGVAGRNIYRMFAKPDELFYNNQEQTVAVRQREAIPTPYKKVSAFKIDEPVAAFEMVEGRIFIGVENTVREYDASGVERGRFRVEDVVRDIVAYAGNLYVLHPTKIGVYTPEGGAVQSWEACSEESDYCSLTAFDGGVFVTDAANKNICQYTLEGGFKRFINSPNEFIVPSYSFGITNLDGKVYCSNPGRHTVECYTVDGEFVTAFGEAGTGAGQFSGCCNPVHVTTLASGDIITSEKGIPRISCYSPNGKFHGVLLGEDALGIGHEAREVRVEGDRLVVAALGSVSIFQYDEQYAQATACGDCEIECPLRRGVTLA